MSRQAVTVAGGDASAARSGIGLALTTSFGLTKGDGMNPRSTDTSDEDITLTLLRTVDDGSMKGLAQFHLLKMQLENIRALPERRYADRNAPRR